MWRRYHITDPYILIKSASAGLCHCYNNQYTNMLRLGQLKKQQATAMNLYKAGFLNLFNTTITNISQEIVAYGYIHITIKEIQCFRLS